MQDRLRLKLNPPNVAVPQGARDLYVNADGNLVQESPNGDKAVVGTGSASATYDSTSAVLVSPEGTDLERGAALVAAYAAAKLLTPGGSALSATNRATVLLPIGKYKLEETLDLDTDFVDIAALNPLPGGARLATDQDTLPENGGTSLDYFRPPPTYVYRDDSAQECTMTQSAADVRLTGFGICHVGDPTAWLTAFQLPVAAFMILDVNNSPSIYTTMYFWCRASYFEEFGGVRGYWSFRGTWIDCIASSCSFRTGYGDTTNFPAEITFEATLKGCSAGPYSYVGDAYPGETYVCKNSTFDRCISIGKCYELNSDPNTTISGFASFAGCTTTGANVQSTCTFIECEAGPNSFGVGATTAGTFIRCRGGLLSFGATELDSYPGNFSGYAEDCVAGANSFGGTKVAGYGKLTGTLLRCKGEGNTQAVRCEGAKIRDSRITATTTGIHALQVIDGNCKFSNSDIIVLQGGTGIPVYAASALNASVQSCRMNNAGNDADGLGANVTNTVTTPYNVVSDAVV